MLKSKLLCAAAGMVFLMAGSQAQAADCGNNGSGFSSFLKAFHKEAAAQGLVAGLNAAARARDLATVTFDRRDSYIGVMIDDLILQGVNEPYRMMTARAVLRILGIRYLTSL